MEQDAAQMETPALPWAAAKVQANSAELASVTTRAHKPAVGLRAILTASSAVMARCANQADAVILGINSVDHRAATPRIHKFAAQLTTRIVRKATIALRGVTAANPVWCPAEIPSAMILIRKLAAVMALVLVKKALLAVGANAAKISRTAGLMTSVPLAPTKRRR